VIRWDQPGYEIAFTTRSGGVSEGPYASLNLGARSDDLTERVEENRRRACAEVGAVAERLTFNRQVHSSAVHQAKAGERGVEGDGLWTGEPGVPLLVLAADCVPIALVTTRGERRLAVLHAGWRGLAAGVVEEGVRALGPGPLAAAIGPAIGSCCYEVGLEVSDHFDSDLTSAGKLDLGAAAERRLRAAGVSVVERLDLCTACHPELLFSHRRDRGLTGRQGVIGVVAG
jgi:YfiH family protein